MGDQDFDLGQQDSLIRKKQDVLSPQGTKRTPEWADVWPQILASIIALSCTIQVGIGLGYTGLLIPELVADPRMTGVNKDSLSWVASLFTIAYAIGALFLPLMDVIGRKKYIIVSTAPFSINWAIMYATEHSVWMIYIARIFSGFAAAGVSGTAVVYVAEITHAEFRGSLLSTISFFNTSGLLLSAVIGSILEWHSASMVFGCISAVNLLAVLFLPESPYWQAGFTTMETEKLVKSVRYLNRRDSLFDEAWSQIELVRNAKKEGGITRHRPNVKEILKDRRTYIPLLISIFLALLSVLSGIYTVYHYPVNIFESCCGKLAVSFNPYSAVIVINIIRVVLTLVVAWMAKFIGRRPLLILSGIVMAISCTVSAIFMWLNNVTSVHFQTGPDTTAESNIIFSYIVVVSMIALVVGSNLGLSNFPWTLPSELLPSESKALGSTFILIFGSGLMFANVKAFPYIVDYITLPGLFLFQAVVSGVTVVFVYLYLPETFRKNFDEISKYFENSQTDGA